jgi:hypothetical protein
VESTENTDQFFKDETLIEEKSILTQELILGGHEVPCEFNLEKNDLSMENNDQLAKDEEISDEKFTNDLTQELKLVGQQMSYDFIFGEWQESAKKSLSFLFIDKAYEKWWMTNQFSNNVFEIEHPHWLLGSHDLKIYSKWLLQLKDYNNAKSGFCYFNSTFVKNLSCKEWSLKNLLYFIMYLSSK